MEIGYTKKTHITGKLMEEIMPDVLRDKDIILNLGNSNLSMYNIPLGCVTLNHPLSVRNSANKKRMFELFQQNNIRCLKYVPYGVGQVRLYNRHQLFKRKYYATVREDKLREFRIIVFKNKILKTYEKVPNNNDFVLKKENCTFKRVRFPFQRDIETNIINSVRCLGLDLAGVDMLINKKGEDKIIEVNSGPGMGIPTIKMLYREIRKLVPINEEVTFNIGRKYSWFGLFRK